MPRTFAIPAAARIACFAIFACAFARAAEIRVFSELSRIRLNGEVVAADRGAGTKPREILSPAAARNGYASFHVLVDATAEEKWALYVGQNPDKALAVTVYREVFAEGIPVRLEAVTQPVEGSGPAVIWLDLWVDKNATVQRVKIEPELQVEGVRDWITYPMEVRVLSTVFPQAATSQAAAQSAGSDAAGMRNLSAWLCKTPPVAAVSAAPNQGPTPLGLIARNAAQDDALLKDSPDVDWLWLATKATDRKIWCKNPVRPAGAGAEWYLRIRDRLLNR